MIRRVVTVRGHVQGVGFRYSCALRAAELAVSGSVRNRSDGSVEADVEGDPDAVDALISWMRTGPPPARVREVTVATAAPNEAHGFRVE